MRAKPLFVAAACVLLATLVGVAFFAAQSRTAAEAERSALTSQCEGLRRDLSKAELALANAERQRTVLAAASAPPTPGPKPAETAPPRPRPSVPGLIEMSRDNPGLWNAFIASKTAEAGKYYGPFFRSLGLNEEQIAKFKAIRAAYGARGADIAAATDAQNLTREDPAIAALWEQSTKQLAVDQRALLGEQDYRRLQDYERTMPARGMAHGLATAVAFDDPLSAQQADQLTQALAEASPAYRAGGTPDLTGVDWAAVDRQAKTFLTPAQYTVWVRGAAHDPVSGSRAAIQLKAIYDRAVQQENARATSKSGP